MQTVPQEASPQPPQVDHPLSSSRQMPFQRELPLKSSALLYVVRLMSPGASDCFFFLLQPNNNVSGQHPVSICGFSFRAPVYTNLHDLQHPYLAVHGHYNLWFLCAKIYRPDLITWVVVYNVTAGVTSDDYSVDTCYSVLLNVVV